MAKPPYFKFYVQDFLNGVKDMTAEEIGAYTLLLCEQWDKRFIKKDEKFIKKVAKISQKKLKKVLEKFEIIEENFVNIRLQKELDLVDKFYEKQAHISKLAGKSKNKPMPTGIPVGLPVGVPVGLPNQNQNHNQNHTTADAVGEPTPAISLGDFLNGMDVKGYLPIEELKARSLGDHKFVEACFQIGLLPDVLPAWLDAFSRWLEFSNETLKQEKDYRFHFRNWIKMQDYRNGKAEDYQAMEGQVKSEASNPSIHKSASQILAERNAQP